jgi:hypothetical protein
MRAVSARKAEFDRWSRKFGSDFFIRHTEFAQVVHRLGTVLGSR